MDLKLIALGNVLMCDDGIAIAIAKVMEQELTNLNIEVIYGETDAAYCISMIKNRDYLIIMDASYFGKSPGEITKLTFQNYENDKLSTQHSFRLFDTLKQFFPEVRGFILTIEISEVLLHFGLSLVLKEKIEEIAKEALDIIKSELQNQNVIVRRNGGKI